MTNLIDDLVEYTGRGERLVKARCAIASTELAWQFEKHRENPLDFYRNSDLYIFALTLYQTKLQDAGVHDWLRENIKRYGWKTMLDYGGGIGEYTIIGKKAGLEVVYLDVRGSKTADYALHRFYKNEIGQPLFWAEGHKIDKDFDVVVAMDVFEHLENPQEVIEQIAKHTKYLICNPMDVKYNWPYPQHISKFDIEPYFENIGSYLWRRK